MVCLFSLVEWKLSVLFLLGAPPAYATALFASKYFHAIGFFREKLSKSSVEYWCIFRHVKYWLD